MILSCLGYLQTLHNSLLIPESVSYFRQRHKYGNHSKCVNLLVENRIVSQKDGIIQEMLYEKYPVLPLKLPVLIQILEDQMENFLKSGIVYRNGFMNRLEHKINQVRKRKLSRTCKSITYTMPCQEIF